MSRSDSGTWGFVKSSNAVITAALAVLLLMVGFGSDMSEAAPAPDRVSAVQSKSVKSILSSGAGPAPSAGISRRRPGFAWIWGTTDWRNITMYAQRWNGRKWVNKWQMGTGSNASYNFKVKARSYWRLAGEVTVPITLPSPGCIGSPYFCPTVLHCYQVKYGISHHVFARRGRTYRVNNFMNRSLPIRCPAR